MATVTYITTAAEDEIITWELARRAATSKTPPKDAQALVTLEIGHLFYTWQMARKTAAITKLQTDPAGLTTEDKTLLGV